MSMEELPRLDADGFLVETEILQEYVHAFGLFKAEHYPDVAARIAELTQNFPYLNERVEMHTSAPMEIIDLESGERIGRLAGRIGCVVLGLHTEAEALPGVDGAEDMQLFGLGVTVGFTDNENLRGTINAESVEAIVFEPALRPFDSAVKIFDQLRSRFTEVKRTHPHAELEDYLGEMVAKYIASSHPAMHATVELIFADTTPIDLTRNELSPYWAVDEEGVPKDDDLEGMLDFRGKMTGTFRDFEIGFDDPGSDGSGDDEHLVGVIELSDDFVLNNANTRFRYALVPLAHVSHGRILHGPSSN